MTSTKTILSYLGPQEVEANRASVLVGSFDKNQVAAISAAEGSNSLKAGINLSTGIWNISLEKGFDSAGTRTVQVKATDKTGKVIGEQTINIKVNPASNTPDRSFTLITLQDTQLKAGTVPSGSLNSQQKAEIPAGKSYQISSYELEDEHLNVELNNPISPVGKSGFFYEKHAVITKGSKILIFDRADLPTPPPGMQLLWVNKKTWLKRNPADSTILSPTQKVRFDQGETFNIFGYACVESHFRVTLDRPIPNFGNSGFMYSQHVQILQDGKGIACDRNAVTMTVVKTTVLKKRPVDAVKLQLPEKITLPAGMIYGISGFSIEQGHIKVSLTENLPPFGNTGFVYPDFVQFAKGGKSFNPAPNLTYQGPTEVLVNQSIALSGTFDKQEAAKVEVIAEDKYPLTVTLNQQASTWQVNLPKGFSVPGARWLRLRATDSKGNITASQIIYITVSSDPLTVGKDLSLKIVSDTWFKVAPVDGSRLNNQQKVLVKAGQTLALSKYGFIDGHLKVVLDSTISPIGTFGYFYEPDVQLAKGTKVLKFDLADVPNSNGNAQLLVTQTTLIKGQPKESSKLPANQIAELTLGSTYAITGYACILGHFRVTFAEAIPGFGNVGFIYWQSVQIKKNGKEVPFDPDALTMTMLQPTVFKKRPVDAAKLTATERTTLPLGRVYGVESYGLETDHLKVSLTEELQNFGNTGYVFPSFVQFKRGDKIFDPVPNNVELNVPYFSQRDNPRFDWSTCNVTAIAMVLYYYGVRSKYGGQLEDELLQWCFDYAGQGSQTDHNVLSALIKAYGFKTSFDTTRKWADVRSELLNRRPIVLAGDFTAAGHIITLIGYNSEGYIVQDPWGDALTGYRDTEGRKLMYPYGYINQVAGPDGNVWAHFISR
ncbi:MULTISPECIES: C39 family peptidase [unclassified Microcoleus]|uniref:C39 family peptidase n=1 Tax=unclassified Microcoleus TaxID=2642155 RepID=UPI001D3D6FA3|nr:MULTISPECIES: C39 family peptidase [unclassified Microcoleus]MCC3600913.1 C39 family peptidase [Microcoleus sp. PH2017_26_ELK_O_A]MCC3626079.1 C39 family peptidase [Microcoleus sp. PH2017_36_ELK_O_B]